MDTSKNNPANTHRKQPAEDNPPRFRFSPIYSAVSLALLALPIHAQTVTAVSNGQWDATTVWSDGAAPNSSFDYLIGSGRVVNSPPAPFGTFSYAFDGGSLTVQAGGTLALVGNNNSTTGNVSYSIPGLTINSGGTLALSMLNVGNTDRTLTTGLTLAGPGSVSITPTGGTYSNGLTLAPTAALSGSANINATMAVTGTFNRKYLRISSANNTYTGNWNITSTGAAATGDARGTLYANAVNALGTGSVTLSSSMLNNQVANGLDSISGVNVGANSLVQVNANWNAPTSFVALTSATSQVTVNGANTFMNIGNLSGVAGSSITGTGAGEILALNSTADSLYAGTLGGTLSLLKSGTATTTLSGAGSSVGNTNVVAGTLNLAQTGAFTNTLDYATQSGATTQIAVNSTLNVNGIFTQAANSTLNVAIGSAQPIINANSASLNGTLNITGLSVPNTASALSGTPFNIIHTSAPGGITGNFAAVTLGGNTLDYLQVSQLTANTQDYNLNFGLTWQAGSALGNGVFTLAGAADRFNVDVALANQVGPFTSNWDGTTLTKNGLGTLELSAANTYTGDTLINAGTLRTGAVNTLASSGAVTVSNGATLDLNGFSQTVDNLSGAGSVATGGAALAANSTADTTFDGVISGTGSLVKSGASTLTLTGNNTYSGPTTVNGGTLQIGNGVTTGGIVSDIANNAALVFNHNNDFAYSGSLSGTGNLTKQGSGILSLTGGSASSQGSVTVAQGTLQLLQNQPLTVSGNYNTEAGATTDIGQINSTLNVGGIFTQAANAILSVTLGSSPDIVAQSAMLGGTLVIRGFSDSEAPVKASDILNDTEYTMLRTTGGIDGGFDNNPLTPSGLDYLLYNGHISNTLDYNLGFQLAWLEGGVADGTGTFTMATNTAFDIDVALGDQTGPFTSGWDGKSLIKKGDGLLVLSAANTYTGSTTIESGTLALSGDADIATSSSTSLSQSGATLSIAEVSGAGAGVQNLSGVSGSQLLLAGKTITVTNSTDTTFAGDFDASNGGLIKNGNASLTLSGQTAYTGHTQLDEGTLVLDGSQGGAQLISNVVGQSGTQLSLLNRASLTGWIDPTSVAVDTTSRWNMTANSQVDNLSNGGTVAFVAPTASDVKTLTVNGNYVGNNGLLVMNTQLGDDNSLTDKLVVAGNTSGTTHVQINNAGGSGAQTLNGIEVISVGGQSDGQFVQSGRIAAGAYDYTLGRGTEAGQTGNWYLTSDTNNRSNDATEEPTERPEAGAYSANLAAANNMFVTRLHDRLGETQYTDVLTGEQKVTSLWLRNEGGHNRSRDERGQLKTQANRYVVQLGGDIAQWSHDGLDRFHLGLMAGYGNSKSNTVSQVSGHDAKGAVDGYSVGAYGTWYANAADKSGLYVDGWMQYSWFNNSVDGQGLASEEYKSKGVTASVESGYTFKLGENAAQNASYFIQPKAQLTWMGVKADDHKETNGTRIAGEGNNNIQTRLGVKAFINGYADQDKGKDRVFQPFIEANWVHNTQDFGTTMDGISVKQEGAANIAELKMGVEGQLSKQLSLWGNVGQQVGNKGYSDTAVMLAVKYNF
ncbi:MULTISPECIES: autotransporter outer membrane beta-barrel domain-containing protein [unclassified Serratia (in: enterobacteria)]|uniref:autotransporter outer membrane beta-barrel domain-containing protein n=1 Tax=unclassified Serratia (in: enterobacteria) TaxID=2647522 RepID=UPI0030768080